MELRHLKEIIRNYLDGKASQKENLLIGRWLHKLEKEALEASDTGEYRLIKEQVLQRLRMHYRASGGQSNAKVLFWIKHHWLSIAASLTILVGAFIGNKYQYEILDVVNPITWTTVSTSAYQVKHILLPDSSTVVLNAGSEITFPARFRGYTRPVSLDGEAYFEVKKDAQRTFIVDAGAMDVTVLGTSFIISSSTRLPEAKVMVRTGKVSVMPRRYHASVLHPNDALIIDKRNTTQTIRHDIEADMRWTANKLIFKETKLAEVFEAMEELFSVAITVNDSALLSLSFTGAFERGDSLPDIFKVIELSYGLRITENGKNKVMIVKRTE